MNRRDEVGLGLAATLLTAYLAATGASHVVWAIIGGIGVGLLIRALLSPPTEGGSSPPPPPPDPPPSLSRGGPVVLGNVGDATQIVIGDVAGDVNLGGQPPPRESPADPPPPVP
jgi:hypothetical protein